MLAQFVVIMSLILAFALQARADSPFKWVDANSSGSATNTQQQFLDAYNYVTAFFPDHGERATCAIQIRFTDLHGFLGFTPKAEPCNDTVLLSNNLKGQISASVVFAHEIVHVIRHQANPNEAVWLDEGLASEVQAKYVQLWPILPFAGTNRFAISQNSNDYTADAPSYATSFTLVHYLASHLGGDEFLKALMSSPKSGWDAIEVVAPNTAQASLIDIPRDRLNRKDLFTHFAFALRLNDPAIADYGLFAIDPSFDTLKPGPPLKAKAPLAWPGEMEILYLNRSDLLGRLNLWSTLDPQRVRIYAVNTAPNFQATEIHNQAEFTSAADFNEIIAIGLPR